MAGGPEWRCSGDGSQHLAATSQPRVRGRTPRPSLSPKRENRKGRIDASHTATPCPRMGLPDASDCTSSGKPQDSAACRRGQGIAQFLIAAARGRGKWSSGVLQRKGPPLAERPAIQTNGASPCDKRGVESAAHAREILGVVVRGLATGAGPLLERLRYACTDGLHQLTVDGFPWPDLREPLRDILDYFGSPAVSVGD